MPFYFKIYTCEKVPDEMLNYVVDNIKRVYYMNFRIVGVRLPHYNAWHDMSNSYDSPMILQNIINEGSTFFLWIVEVPISLEGKVVYGYAELRKGSIVSISKLQRQQLAFKEAAYQFGFMIGLSDCSKDCLMNKTTNFGHLIEKASTLCQDCEVKFRRLKIRYV